MSYLLLTSKFDEVASLLDLDNPEHQTRLRDDFKHSAHTGDGRWDRIYVIDPKINDGQPTVCQTTHEQSKFNEDDYADATAIIYCNDGGKVETITRVGYRVDGRV